MHKDVTVDNSETSDEIRSSELWAALDSKSEMKVEGASEERLMMDYPETQNPSKDSSVKSVREEAKPGCCGDTVIFPLVQMGSFGVRLDQEVTGQLLRTAEPGSHCVLASGYFNLTKEYMELVVGSKAKYDILMASPKVSIFFLKHFILFLVSYIILLIGYLYSLYTTEDSQSDFIKLLCTENYSRNSRRPKIVRF